MSEIHRADGGTSSVCFVESGVCSFCLVGGVSAALCREELCRGGVCQPVCRCDFLRSLASPVQPSHSSLCSFSLESCLVFSCRCSCSCPCLLLTARRQSSSCSCSVGQQLLREVNSALRGCLWPDGVVTTKFPAVSAFWATNHGKPSEETCSNKPFCPLWCWCTHPT